MKSESSVYPARQATFKRTSELLSNCFATPSHLSGLPGKLSGCIYRADGTKVALSERLGGYKGDHVESDNPAAVDAPKNAQRLSGRGLYLGHYMSGHYGHFITETLSTFWIFEQYPADRFEYFMFHPFVFGDQNTEYARDCFDAFGIPQDKILIVGSDPIYCNELLIPERLFHLNHSADTALRWVYDRISQSLETETAENINTYISRRKFSRKNFLRVVANEVDIEYEFMSRGYKIVYPELLSFKDQVNIFHKSSIMAGISGSGLHNSLFMSPNSKLLEIGDPRYLGEPAPTQILCNSISGVDSYFIPFRGIKYGRRITMVFDMKKLRLELNAILGRTDKASRIQAPFLHRILALIEIIFLMVRPLFGEWARYLLGITRNTSRH